ncbi:MAG: hypothetical protein NTZ87_02505 [Candidatus Nomurabacteria bacterium]|nr:hypothetical protein [Candidatus Nomurabacteria bacterium]
MTTTTFDFSVRPPLSLEEESATLLDWPTGEREVKIWIEQGELFVQGKRIVPYMPAFQAECPNDVDLRQAVSLLKGLPLVHPMLAQVLNDHPDLIPGSLSHFLSCDYTTSSGGIIFPSASVTTWTGKKALLSLFTVGGTPYFSYPILDRLPHRRSYLIEIGQGS